MKTIRRCVLLALAFGVASGVAQAQARRPKRVVLANAAPSRAKVPLVTRDNFISLSMNTSGGIANIRTGLTVQNNGISRFSGPAATSGAGFPGGGGGFGQGAEVPSSQPGIPPGYGSGFGYHVPRSFGSVLLSNNQLDLLLRAINSARLPALAGKYEQKNLADGINETVTLTISDEANRDRTFTIQNYGDQAPRAYYAFTSRLRAFTALKFPEPVEPAKPVAPPGTVQRTVPQ